MKTTGGVPSVEGWSESGQRKSGLRGGGGIDEGERGGVGKVGRVLICTFYACCTHNDGLIH